jgi:hypothetical protein
MNPSELHLTDDQMNVMANYLRTALGHHSRHLHSPPAQAGGESWYCARTGYGVLVELLDVGGMPCVERL